MKFGPQLICFGEVLWDMLLTGPQPGGAAANVAVAASACSTETMLISAVGKDALGEQMLERLKERNVLLNGLSVSAALPTSTVEVTLNEAGEPCYCIQSGVAWDEIALTDALVGFASRAQAFYFGSLAQRSEASHNALYALLAVLPAGCLRFYDINLREPYPEPETVRRSLEQATVLKLNEGELAIVADWFGLPQEEASFVQALFSSFALETVLLTKGESGAVVFNAEQPSGCYVPAHRVQSIANSVGAGDAFSAGFLCGRLKGMDAMEAASFGSELAVAVCGSSGAWLPADFHSSVALG